MHCQLTPNFAFLSEHPIVLPELPHPVWSGAPLPDSVVLAFYARHHRSRRFIISLSVVHH